MDCFASETSTHGSALRLEDEACQILRASTSAKDILLICSYFPFQYSDPLGILSTRRTENNLTDIDELEFRKAADILIRIATECNSSTWNWQWSPPFASSTMGPTRAANDIDKDLLVLASKVTFMAVVRNACSLPSTAVEDIFDGVDHARLLLDYRFNELDISKKEYEGVEKELKNPLACWIFSTSLRSSGGSPVPSDAMASILNPIKGLFENRELPLMAVLQRLKVLEVLYQDIRDGVDPKWEGLLEEDFSFLEDVGNNTPQKLAELLTDKDLSCSQKFCPKDFLCPAELRSEFPQWSRLIRTVRVCAKAHPDFVWRIEKAAKILLNQRNFFSAMALMYGLFEANHRPAEWWWDRCTVRKICMAYQVKGWLLELPQCIEDDAGCKPIGAEAKIGRSCLGVLPKIISTLSATLFGMQQNMADRPYTSESPPEHKEELSRELVDSMAGGSWSDGSIMACTGPEEVHWLETEGGRNGVEKVGSIASSLWFSGLGIPGQHATTLSHADPDHQEIAPPPATYHDSDLDSAIRGLDRRDSTTTLSSSVCNPVEKYGRKYHGFREGKYMLPNDEEEQARLDFQSAVFDFTLSGRLQLVQLFFREQRVLDVGTGTGIWAINFAEKHPNAEVYGVDLSHMQPQWVPPNCTFQIDDLSLPWTFEFRFDFIHGRMLFCSFSDPLHVFREAFQALTAGGVLEMQDIIFDFRSFNDSLKGSALEEWAKKLKERLDRKESTWLAHQNTGTTLRPWDLRISNRRISIGQWAYGQRIRTSRFWAGGVKRTSRTCSMQSRLSR